MCASNEPGMDEVGYSGSEYRCGFQEVVGDATGDKNERTPGWRKKRPRLPHQDTHGAFDDVEDVVFRAKCGPGRRYYIQATAFEDSGVRFSNSSACKTTNTTISRTTFQDKEITAWRRSVSRASN